MGSLYSEQRTWLHGVPAGFKLLLLAVLGTGLYLTDRPDILLVSALLCAFLFLSLGQATAGARKLVFSILVAGLLVAAFHVFMQQAMLGISSALRLFSTALMGVCLTLSTRYTDLLLVFERVLSPLQRFGVQTERLALQLALVLRFTEHFFVLWRRLDDSYRLRTGRAGGFRLLAPLTIQMLVSARRVADTLEIRLGK